MNKKYTQMILEQDHSIEAMQYNIDGDQNQLEDLSPWKPKQPLQTRRKESFGGRTHSNYDAVSNDLSSNDAQNQHRQQYDQYRNFVFGANKQGYKSRVFLDISKDLDQ